MAVIEVNHDLCCKDSLCIAECPALLLITGEGGYPTTVPNANDLCLDCGHCVAVCPKGALFHRFLKPEDCLESKPNTTLQKKELEYFLRSRRSIRQYKDLAVRSEVIETILFLAKYAPSARNLQPVKWIVLNGKEKVYYAATLVLDWMKSKLNGGEFLYFREIVDAWSQGNDRILRGAPALLIGYAHKLYDYAKSDVATSISYVELAALSYGLGTCWSGYFTAACQSCAPLKNYINLPDNHFVHGAVMIGVSNASYYRMPERKNPDIMWI